MLLLIGFQECPTTRSSMDKEEKVDLINLGVLVVLESLGFFRRIPSENTWPQFEPTELKTDTDKETLIKQGIVAYFDQHKID